MATTATGARASRRAAATAARRNVQAAPPSVAEPEVIEAPEALADFQDDDPDEGFGPEDVEPSIGQIVSDARQGHAEVIDARSQVRAPARVQLPQAGALALPQEDLSRKLDAGDFLIPKLRLSQAMSKANTLASTSRGSQGVPQGNWYVSTKSSENLGETVYFIPVDLRKSRSFFVTGSGLMCRSFDMLNGEGDPGGACEGSLNERLTLPATERGCPLRLWNDKTPPKCGETYNIAGLMISESQIEDAKTAKPMQVMLQLRSTGAQCGKAIITMMANEGQGVWHNLVVELGVEVKTNTRGTFFIPTAEFYDTTDAPEFDRIRRRAASMARAMGNQSTQAFAEDDTLDR
jgi:hypothetical protein